MRKVLAAIVAFLCFASTVLAADTPLVLTTIHAGRQKVTILRWKDSTGDGAVSTVQLPVWGKIYSVVTKPGSNPPESLLTITFIDPNTGLDLMGGALATRSLVNTELAYPYRTGTTVVPYPVIAPAGVTATFSTDAHANIDGYVYVFWEE